MNVGDEVIWGEKSLKGRIVAVDGDYAVVEIEPDLMLDLDVTVRKFFVPGMRVRIHMSSLVLAESGAGAAA